MTVQIKTDAYPSAPSLPSKPQGHLPTLKSAQRSKFWFCERLGSQVGPPADCRRDSSRAALSSARRQLCCSCLRATVVLRSWVWSSSFSICTGNLGDAGIVQGRESTFLVPSNEAQFKEEQYEVCTTITEDRIDSHLQAHVALPCCCIAAHRKDWSQKLNLMRHAHIKRHSFSQLYFCCLLNTQGRGQGLTRATCPQI